MGAVKGDWYIRKDDLNGFKVSGNQEGCIASQKSNRQALEKVFDFHSGSLSPSASFLRGQLLQEIPAAKRFDDERMEEDPLELDMTVLNMHAIFGCFPHFDGGSFCSSM